MIVIIMITPFSVSVLILGVTPVVSPLTLVVPPLKFSSFSPMKNLNNDGYQNDHTILSI